MRLREKEDKDEKEEKESWAGTYLHTYVHTYYLPSYIITLHSGDHGGARRVPDRQSTTITHTAHVSPPPVRTDSSTALSSAANDIAGLERRREGGAARCLFRLIIRCEVGVVRR